MAEIFNLIIAMVFIYAFFASLVSGVNEIIGQLLVMRGRILFEGIAMMLGELPQDTGSRMVRWYKQCKRKLGFGDTQNARLTNELYAHPLIDTLSPPGSSRPSYISPQTFSAALVQVMAVDGSTDQLKQALQDRSKPLNRLLGPMLDEAQGNLDAFKAKVENHYNAVMDRAGGWYKRRTQVMMFFVGLLLAGCLNVDSIYIVQQLQKDPEQVHKLVQAASDYTEVTGEEADEGSKAVEQLIDEVRQLNIKTAEFKSLGLPVGWRIIDTDHDILQTAEQSLDAARGNVTFALLPGQDNPFLVALGWLMTALAGALGAPFWFDAVSKLFALRSSGKKPQ